MVMKNKKVKQMAILMITAIFFSNVQVFPTTAKKYSVKLNQEKATLKIGKQLNLRAMAENCKIKKIKWSSSNNRIVRILKQGTSKGVGVAIRSGKSIISAKGIAKMKKGKITFHVTCMVTVKKTNRSATVLDAETNQTSSYDYHNYMPEHQTTEPSFYEDTTTHNKEEDLGNEEDTPIYTTPIVASDDSEEDVPQYTPITEYEEENFSGYNPTIEYEYDEKDTLRCTPTVESDYEKEDVPQYTPIVDYDEEYIPRYTPIADSEYDEENVPRHTPMPASDYHVEDTETFQPITEPIITNTPVYNQPSATPIIIKEPVYNQPTVTPIIIKEPVYSKPTATPIIIKEPVYSKPTATPIIIQIPSYYQPTPTPMVIPTPVPQQNIVPLTDDEVRLLCFDAKYYADHYDDLKSIYGYDEEKLYEHWILFGQREGRESSPIWNPMYYLDHNSDVKEVGNGFYLALEHFRLFGYAEYRASSEYYDGKYYQNRFLSEFKNFTSKELLLHMRNFGVREGRQASNKKYNGSSSWK